MDSVLIGLILPLFGLYELVLNFLLEVSESKNITTIPFQLTFWILKTGFMLGLIRPTNQSGALQEREKPRKMLCHVN